LQINKKLWLNRFPNELSGGELQRFCVARVLSPKTEFIIADEMSTMLDAITQAQIWSVLLKKVKERNLGLLVITHNTALVEKLCTRIVNLKELNQIQM
ncbi:MAG: ABC transporter ATP-binding protein, partial [Oscillospiraceae bacterium]|nr:ABC transporter ATP-binding protein [Oscillospiraceae bacterium]